MLFFIGVYWAVVSAVTLLDAGRTALWPRVTGTIVASTQHVDTLGMIRKWRSPGYDPRYDSRPLIAHRAHATYVYDVNGERYTGNVIGRDRDAYQPGDRVTVHYDPTRPRVGVVDVSVPWMALGELIFALGLAVGAWVSPRARASEHA
jgi:Protein of unknown function (DUF3592)